jgi:hypothetical protein
MFVNPKESVMAIMNTILNSQDSLRSAQELISRIGGVSQILQEHPELKNDREIYGSLLSATKNSADKKIIQFRRRLIVDHCLPFDNKIGKLTITEDELNQLTTDELWTYIEKQCIKSLVISLGEGKSVIYDKGFLKRLLQNKPQIEDLTEMYTLQFEDGSITVPKAKLRLCGEYFENAFDSKMSENTNKVFPFVNMSREAYKEILHAIETEEYDFSKSSEEFKFTAEYFQFYAEFEFSEKIFARQVLEKHLGNVGEVPLPPKELLEAMEAPCPFSNNEKVKTKDTHIITWVPPKVGNNKLSPNRLEALINSDKSGANKIGFDRNWTRFPEGVADQEVEGGYWLMMLKKPLDATKNMTYEVAEHHIQQNYKNYDIPTVKDAMLCVLMNYVCSGEKKERILARENPLRYTWCKENGKFGSSTVWHMIVGALASSGLNVNRIHGARGLVGLCPLRKFCATL